MKAWLPKASTENERSTVVIETPEGVEVLTRQIAGAVARRIVTYAEVGEECYIDEHMGFKNSVPVWMCIYPLAQKYVSAWDN
jgi:phosphatidylserine decarboxylase